MRLRHGEARARTWISLSGGESEGRRGEVFGLFRNSRSMFSDAARVNGNCWVSAWNQHFSNLSGSGQDAGGRTQENADPSTALEMTSKVEAQPPERRSKPQ